jgi:hypothetical protein
MLGKSSNKEGKAGGKFASPLSSEASAAHGGERLPARGKKEEETAHTGEGGDNVFPGEEALAVVDSSLPPPNPREGSTDGRRKVSRPPSLAAELPRAAVSMADGRGHEAVAQRDGVASIWGLEQVDLLAARSCGGGVDWSSPRPDCVWRHRRLELHRPETEGRRGHKAAGRHRVDLGLGTGRTETEGRHDVGSGRAGKGGGVEERGTGGAGDGRTGREGRGVEERSALAFATPLLETRFFPLPLLLLWARQTSICLSSYAFYCWT